MKKFILKSSFAVCAFAIANFAQSANAQLGIQGTFCAEETGGGMWVVDCGGSGYCGHLRSTNLDGTVNFTASDGSSWVLYSISSAGDDPKKHIIEIFKSGGSVEATLVK